MYRKKQEFFFKETDKGAYTTADKELKTATTVMVTGTSLKKRFNEQNNSCARAF